MTVANAPKSNYRLWLLRELAQRQTRNPAYSLRAFARSIGISHTSLSQVMSGKRPLSAKAAHKITSLCCMSPAESEAFFTSASAFRTRTAKKKQDYLELDQDAFTAISDWHYYAILSLSDLDACEARPEWVAEMLGISRRSATEALSRLERLGIIKIADGKFAQTSQPMTTRQDVASVAVRKYLYQVLQKAETQLATTPVEKRDYSAITMAVNTAKLPEAKALIRKFRRDLAALLESGVPDQVYILSVQLFPVSKSGVGGGSLEI